MQLLQKAKLVKKSLRKYWDEARKWGATIQFMENIIPSPIETHYRNKCEFAVGRNSQGEVTVGFSMGLYREGELNVEVL